MVEAETMHVPSMDLFAKNWAVIRHLYDGLVEVTESGLKNISLHPQHFKVLEHAIHHKEFKGRKRKDDRLLHSVGNWLSTKEYGSWRNPNKACPYLSDNKEIWAEFTNSIDHYKREFSLTKALWGYGVGREPETSER